MRLPWGARLGLMGLLLLGLASPLAARGGGGCFLPQTPVTLADGSTKPISEVRVGDRLLGWAGRMETVTVQKVFTLEVPGYLEVQLVDRTLLVTEEHPFFVKEGEFKTIGSLSAGSWIYSQNEQKLAPRQIRKITPVEKKQLVYNLEVDGSHTYFAQGILVHNKGGGCFPAGTLIRTPLGLRAIETLRPGDEVLAPQADGSLKNVRILQTFEKADTLLTLEFVSGAKLVTTAEHPMGLAGGTFVTAGSLKPGDRLRRLHGAIWQEETLVRAVPGTQVVRVFNLEVQDPHTYLAQEFAVHNKGGGGGFSSRSSSFSSRSSSSSSSRSSSSSSYRSSSSGGSYSGGGVFIFDDEDMGFWMMVLFIAVVYGIYKLIQLAKRFPRGRPSSEASGSQGASSTSSSSSEGNLDEILPADQVEAKSIETRDILDQLAQDRPLWAWRTVETTARETFLLLQKCWMDRDYGPMESRMDPELYQQHLSQIQGMILRHEINILEGLEILDACPLHAAHDEVQGMAQVSVLFTVRCRDTYIDDRSRNFKRGDDEPATFQEVWVFALDEGRWILREIQQTAESNALTRPNLVVLPSGVEAQSVVAQGPSKIASTRVSRTLKALAHKNPLWAMDLVQDQARQVYSALYLAREQGTPEGFSEEFFAPELLARLRSEAQRRQAAGMKSEYANFCIRDFELVLVQPDLKEITIRFQSHALQTHTQQRSVIHEDEDITRFAETWVLVQDQGRWKLKEQVTEM